MKKIKAVTHLIILCLFGILATGCSEKDYGLNPKDPVIISVWHYYNGAQKLILDKKVEEFNNTIGKEKGIIVEAYNQGNIQDLNQKVLDSMNRVVGAEAPPDAFAAYADTAYEISSMGVVTDLGKYMSKEELNEYIPSYFEEGIFSENGELKLFPIAKSTEVFIINETEWERFAYEMDVSTEYFSTWEGIAEVAKQYYEWTDSLTEQPDDGKAFFGRDAMANYMIIGSLQLGHEVFDVNNGEVNYDFDKETMRKLWDNYYIPYVNGYYASYGLFRTDDVKTGDILACVCSTSGAAYFPSVVVKEEGETYPIKSKVYPLPNFEGTEPAAVQQGAGIVVLSSEEKREYATIVFLKWFTEVENNVDFSIGSGYLPVKKEANKETEIKKAIKKSENIPTILEDSLYIGIQTTQDYRLYTNKPFKNGYEARNILADALESKSKSDLEEIEILMEKGMSRKEAVSNFVTEENFDNWFEDTKARLLSAGE